MNDITHLASVIETLRAAKAEIAKWKSVQQACEEKIQAALGDDESGSIDGHKVVTWKTSESVRLDVKAIQAALPAEVLTPYLVVGQRRTFKVVD